MEHDNSDAVLPAIDWGCEGGTAESCITCKKLLDAAQKIVVKGIRRRDHVMEADQAGDGSALMAELGRLGDILSDPCCQDHKEFIRSALLINQDNYLRRLESSEKDAKVEIHWVARKGLAVLSEVEPYSSFDADIMLLDNESSNSGLSCVGRFRDDDFISIGLIKGWISTCEQLHTETCHLPTLPSTSLSWMIDTISGCLVPATEGIRYVTLSYVWGQTEMLKTTTETLSALKEPGALIANTGLKIPPVIQHAIALLPQLGERYLWVDSLCIRQDDAESLARHIRHMASIYEAAVFTIVAADGKDANHGILGIRDLSAARKLPPSLSLTSRLRLRPRNWLNILHSPWGRRGWTLQEHVFSRRKLVFVHGSVQWICQKCRCFEDIHQESPSIRNTKMKDYGMDQELESVGELAVQYPMISQVGKFLSDYTSRHLTLQHDVLNAVDSVFTAHHRAFPHGFYWGLPLDFFDMTLLWRGSYRVGGLSRRRASPSPSQSHFPSWTWAGWVGIIDRTTWSAETYIKDADERDFDGVVKCQTIPICEWRQRSNSDSSEVLIPGQNSAYTYKQRFMGKKDGLPHGWKYEREVFGPRSESDTWKYVPLVDYPVMRSSWALETPYYYSHEAAPGVKFWHPVPISLDPPENVTTAPTNGGLLCARTRSGRLWVTRAKDHPAGRLDSCFDGDQDRKYFELFNGMVKIDTVLTNQERELVGDLNIEDESDRDLVKNSEYCRDEAGYPCELVAISKGHDSVQPMEPEKEEYTFYNVLWVKWEDGIAYRRGVGRVKRETWESMELQDIDLVLG